MGHGLRQNSWKDVELVLDELSDAQEDVDAISEALSVSSRLLEEDEKEDLEEELKVARVFQRNLLDNLTPDEAKDSENSEI